MMFKACLRILTRGNAITPDLDTQQIKNRNLDLHLLTVRYFHSLASTPCRPSTESKHISTFPTCSLLKWDRSNILHSKYGGAGRVGPEDWQMVNARGKEDRRAWPEISFGRHREAAGWHRVETNGYLGYSFHRIWLGLKERINLGGIWLCAHSC